MMRKRGPDQSGAPQASRRARLALAVGTVVAAGAMFVLATPTSFAAQAAGHYKGTRRIVVDKQTRQLRLPTADEAQQIATDLARLTSRSADNLPQTQLPGGGTGVDLQGGFGGVMLARPNEDGTFETKCVFTFSEGAEFLGLVPEQS